MRLPHDGDIRMSRKLNVLIYNRALCARSCDTGTLPRLLLRAPHPNFPYVYIPGLPCTLPLTYRSCFCSCGFIKSHLSGENHFDGEFSAASAKELRRVCDMYREFLDTSIGLGRSLWTQYDTSLMWWGLAVILAATASLAFRAVSSSSSPGTVASRSGVSSGSSSSGR